MALVKHDTTEKRRGLSTRREVNLYRGGWPHPAAKRIFDIDRRRPEELPVSADAVVRLQEEFVVPVDMGDDSGVQELAEFTRKGLVQFCCPAAPLVDVAEVALNLEWQLRLTVCDFPAWRRVPGGGGWSRSSASLSSGIENASWMPAGRFTIFRGRPPQNVSSTTRRSRSTGSTRRRSSTRSGQEGKDGWYQSAGQMRWTGSRHGRCQRDADRACSARRFRGFAVGQIYSSAIWTQPRDRGRAR